MGLTRDEEDWRIDAMRTEREPPRTDDLTGVDLKLYAQRILVLLSSIESLTKLR